MLKRLVVMLCVPIALGVAAPVSAAPNLRFGIEIGPPPVPLEVVPAPRGGFVWAPGYWSWDGGRHVWIEGRWIPERRGYYWVPERWENHWEARGAHWHFAPGRWERNHGRWEHDRGRR